MGVILNENLLKHMTPKARAEEAMRAGHANAGRTADECREIWQRGEEKKLQGLISNFLNMRDIYFETDRMDRKTSGAKGRPDFRICYRGRWVAVECKAEGGQLSREQAATIERIRKAGGVCIVAFGLPAVQEALRAVDAQETINPLNGVPDPAAARGGRS